ncbi:hypothetical protein CNMCM7691_005874 [Aspergillus felis]|uniref:Uncharacterized protein n=1 Tax=Aspergillus felis TaxID=1287682 RepID=A0A8H6R4T6_9EURO|nr:hypothetical protein CNMCM7691_005874 [Aspergillus felis]
MSVTSQDVSAPTIRLVQYAFIPWEAQGREKLTVKLALYCITLLANEASELRPDYAPLIPVSQPPLNTASSLNQARTHAASSPRREQPQEQSTGAPKNQSYTDVSLTEHGNYYTFSLDSGPVAKNKEEWREERDYLFHDGLKVKGKTPQSTTAPSAMSTSAGKKPQSTTAPSSTGYTFVGQLSEHEGHYRTSNGSVNLPMKEWKTIGGYCYHEGRKLQGKKP